MTIRISGLAQQHLDDIFAYSLQSWGPVRARQYVDAILDKFDAIDTRTMAWRRISPRIVRNGFVCRSGSHLIYWRSVSAESVTIVAILHDRMNQFDRLRRAFEHGLT